MHAHAMPYILYRMKEEEEEEEQEEEEEEDGQFI